MGWFFCIPRGDDLTTSLQSLNAFRSTLMVKHEIAEYRTSATAFPSLTTLRYNDSIYDITTTDGTYTGLGPLLSITSSKNALRSANAQISIGISGIPANDARAILYSSIKGSTIQVYRAFFASGTNTPISDLDFPQATGGITGRFAGYVSTYTMEDAIDTETGLGTVTILMDCVPLTGILQRLTKGVRTNPVDLRYLTNDADVSFDNIPALEEAEWFFGGTK